MHKDSDFSLPSASLGKRFLTYIIDVVVMYALWFAAIAVLGGIFFATNDLASIEAGAAPSDTFIVSMLLGYLVLALFPFAYLCVMEGLKGQTIGKMAAGTIVVTTDGQQITMGKAIVRTLCRIIPFEVFSGLFRDSRVFWHDSIADTRVVMKDDWLAYLDGENEFGDEFE